MNVLTRRYKHLAYTLTKWYMSRKLKRFLSPRHYRAVIAYYDAIWEA